MLQHLWLEISALLMFIYSLNQIKAFRRSVDKVINDPQIKAREMIVELEHPVAGNMKVPGVPIKFSATPGSVDTPAPLLGQHTEEIMKELLGWDEEKTKAFFAEQ